MININRKQRFMPLGALALFLVAVPSATAASCEDFKLSLKNATSDEIKVRKVEYRDQGVWRTENMLGIDGFEKIEPGHTKSFTRNLQRIGGETTRFRVTYAHHHGGNDWDPDIVVESSSFTCSDGGSRTVTLSQ